MTEVVRDANLDNTDADIEAVHTKIKNTLAQYDITVDKVSKYIDSTVFLLSPNSIRNLSEVKRLYGNKPNRYALECEESIVNRNIVNEETGVYLGRIPTRTKSIAIRRFALKKLPRPIFLSFVRMTVLFGLLTALIWFVYAVSLL